MLRLYYGRENLNKDRFLFDRVGESLKKIEQDAAKRILLVVPDQFTLQAEQNAFHYLDVQGLIDLEVLSQSRLGHRVLSQVGGSARLHIDKYGRHMVLAGIVRQLADQLTAYRGMQKSASFIELANDLIMEMKQSNADPEMVLEALSQVEQGSLLYNKLSDIQKIYAGYEEALAGKYIDTEDYMALVTEKLPQSELIRESEIWLYGFDSFTEKSLQMIGALMVCGVNVNLIMTGDRREAASAGMKSTRDGELFTLTDKILHRLSDMAAEANIPWELQEIPQEYQIRAKEDKAPSLLYLEHEIYAYPHKVFREEVCEITFCKAANLYAEVETAAAHIVELARDRGMSYREMAVICNDMGKYGSIIKRIFSRYDIPVFLDEKRTVLHNPAAELVMALLSVIVNGWKQQDVFRLLKTGLYGQSASAETKRRSAASARTEYREKLAYEEIENYAIKYRIHGNRWKTSFSYGVKEYGEDGLEALSLLRESLTAPLIRFEKNFNGAKTGREKSRVLYEALCEDLQLPARLEELLARLNEEKEFAAAEEISQIWKVITGLLDQIVELEGDEELSGEDYALMLQTGFSAVEIGLLPPSQDQVIAGTMQRTRRGSVRAMLILGANDGLIPQASSKEDLLSETEKAILSERDIVLCKDDAYRACEERLAIYKNLSKPEEYLWLGYSATDIDGREKKPSLIFDKLMAIFPTAGLEKDIVNQESDLARIQGAKGARGHMSETFRRVLSGDAEEVPTAWQLTYNRMKASHNEGLSVLSRGLFFTNRVKRLDESLVNRLYKKEGMEDFILSPSRLERFGKCPFSHFIQYGLRPKERRAFEAASREVGDVYHQCLMELSQELTVPDISVTNPVSPWMTWSEEQCRERASQLIDGIAEEYREGVLRQGGQELYRTERMKEIAAQAAWAMVSQVRQGTVRKVFFEAEFGQAEEKPFPPIVVWAGDQQVRIEGKIDRVDVLGGSADYVKIIDYKSGSQRFDMEEAKEGIRLQLMLYLEGAMGGLANSQPAGVFYFEIAEPIVDASNFAAEEIGEKVADQLQRSFKMDGIMVDKPDVVSGIAGEFSGFSHIVPVRKATKGVSGTAEGKLLNEDDFGEFRAQVSQTVQELCAEFVTGDTAIRPKKTKHQNACAYCQLKGICCFDLAFEDCQYR